MNASDTTAADLRHPVLQARDLAFGYAKGKPVFTGVSLEVAPREIVCLLGGSGCGKSTLLRTLAHLEPAHAGQTSGQIRFLGEPLSAPHPRAAMVFQQPGLLPWLDAARNTGFGLDFARQPLLQRAQRAQRVQEALEAVGLAGQGGLYPAELSGGMAQRVALARALAREPVLLLADEPFSALDAITRAEMQELLVDVVHRWQTAALLVTHDIDEAILVGDRILLMGGRPGRIVREWRVDIARPRIADAAAFTALRLDLLAALHAARAPGGITASARLPADATLI
ncbi:ABC transporter ATP-binding protein [Variovorax sp. 770b2]|uniref:ABC transporter ATP-binding protein n=1 Tax=Variovorax sp. 770b2 TaxID=1566271 RepID=UPI0008EE9CCC|nr:ABC transporter ATP-binding protein [Variovorax sp. 770b2]SFQ35053.1 NitT/TauT family transport system ATP-binding protein [Variovorax sp. 770b2]